MSERFIAGWGGYPLVGTPEQVVEGMKQLGETAGYDPRCGPWAEHPVG
jgi:alkanesulfonate monooxygenase SsuD/methylene tetrahydromethanopterin reductase-like flavin-dependent oxidoreductase (luciferase family)